MSTSFRCFVAIDFETADNRPDSACAVGLVRVEGEQIVARAARLIRPPRRDFLFSNVHGITWRDVALSPEFPAVWSELRPFLDGAQALAAHNADFDREVLAACCARAGVAPPELPFICTMKLARDVWGLVPTKLSDVCRFLRVGLEHHDAASDAEACALIVLAAQRDRHASAAAGSRSRALRAGHGVARIPGGKR